MIAEICNNIILIKTLEVLPQEFYYYLSLIVLSFLIGLILYKKLEKSNRLLVQLIVITLISEILATFFKKEISINLLGLSDRTNSPIYHLLQPIQIIYIGLIYSLFFNKFNYHSKIYLPITYVLTLITVSISFTIKPLDHFPSYGSMIQSLFFVFSALLFFYKIIQVPSTTPILKQASFWFNSGNLFFYAVTFVVFGFFQDFQDGKLTLPSWSYTIIAGANFILYPCYLISILLNARENKNARTLH